MSTNKIVALNITTQEDRRSVVKEFSNLLDKVIEQSSYKIDDQDKILVAQSVYEAIRHDLEEIYMNNDHGITGYTFNSSETYNDIMSFCQKQPTTLHKTSIMAQIFETNDGHKSIFTRSGIEMLIIYIRDNCKPDVEQKKILETIANSLNKYKVKQNGNSTEVKSEPK